MNWMRMVGVMVALAMGGCSKEGMLASRSDAAGGLSGLRVSSPAFGYGKMIPKKYTADGDDISPPLVWGAGPTQTKAYIVMVEDPDASGNGPFVHWIAYEIPANQTSLPEGASMVAPHDPKGFLEGVNSKGLLGYVGAEPPPGKVHRYVFEVFAVDGPLDLKMGASKKQVMAEMKGHVLTQGELTGRYQR